MQGNEGYNFVFIICMIPFQTLRSGNFTTDCFETQMGDLL